jgi:hypothetical protein
MKKINTKKLNQFFMSMNNSEEVKSLVTTCVDNFVHGETKNPQCIAILNDLGLLIEA